MLEEIKQDLKILRKKKTIDIEHNQLCHYGIYG